jgi:hypothetical protein
MRDSWIDLEDGYVVVRETEPGLWIVSWHSYSEDHPDYPGHSLSSREVEMPVDGGLDAILEWAWHRYSDERTTQRAA